MIPERDESLRMACFASLDVLRAQHGEDIPYVSGLDAGFPFQGTRVPFFSRMKGIFRAAAQRGPAALAVQTSWKSPYGESQSDDKRGRSSLGGRAEDALHAAEEG